MALMELHAELIPVHTNQRGDVNIQDLAAGKSLKIETSPQGAEVLNYTVPAGKVADVTLIVVIKEYDA